jgi:hypothetical protein
LALRAQAEFERACERHVEMLVRFMDYEELKKERDEARAEVRRLRDVLQGLAHWVSNLATDDQLDRPARKTTKSGREWLGEANAEVQACRATPLATEVDK